MLSLGLQQDGLQDLDLETRLTKWYVTDGTNSRTTNSLAFLCRPRDCDHTWDGDGESKPGSRVSNQIGQKKNNSIEMM